MRIRMSGKTAAIVGMGLMGGSLGLALRRRGWRVVGIGRNLAKLRKGKSLGAADQVTTDPAEARNADVWVLAVPVDRVVPLGRRLKGFVKSGALVTDVGSIKGPIARAFAGWPQFVGAHPMCGSEKTGVVHSRPDLYRGATCVLTPVRTTSPRARAEARRFWESVGAKTFFLSAEEHDRRVALVSHLPHLLAEALVLTATEGPGRAWAPKIAAGSFRDATRVASADPLLWAPIFSMNRDALRRAVSDFQRTLSALVKNGPDEKTLGRVVRRRALFG
jgi:prephenate dehydrogenase